MIRFFRHLWSSIKNLKRNGWMTIVAISTVSITLSLVGIFAAVLLNTERLATGIENNIQVNTYLLVDSTDFQETLTNDKGETVANESYHAVYNQIMALDHVDSIEYSSKDTELAKLQEAMGDAWKLFDEDSNPLQDVYIVNTSDPKYVKTVAEEISKIAGVDSVDYGGTNTERLFKISNIIRIWGLLGTALLLILAIFLISNTVRITIISRSREIQIMRLVGAKNSYIRMPFFLEGAWVGLLGAIIPSAIVYFLYKIAYESFNPNLLRQNLSMYPMNPYVYYLIGALLLIGIIIGSFGSVLSMRRYLKV
ncbi:permease-like cell division protein FtsX [Streptococcus caprae]|uniref:Cell division protein FtsX n=1 Tax=Streptococcus caprae TaxID=1640501 RepID=A0ABV8CX65_9STRE